MPMYPLLLFRSSQAQNDEVGIGRVDHFHDLIVFKRVVLEAQRRAVTASNSERWKASSDEVGSAIRHIPETAEDKNGEWHLVFVRIVQNGWDKVASGDSLRNRMTEQTTGRYNWPSISQGEGSICVSAPEHIILAQRNQVV